MSEVKHAPFLDTATLTGTEDALILQGGVLKRTTPQAIADLASLGATITPNELALNVYNETGGALAAGTLVYVSSYDATAGRFEVAKADADVANARAQYLVTTSISNTSNGTVYRSGTATGLDTSGTTVGDPVYLSTTAGAITKTAPTGSDDIVQIVGRVTVVHASTGQALIDLSSLGYGKIATNEIQDLAITTALIAAGAVTNTKVPAGLISADATGRALFAADVFNAATVDTAFATDAVGEDILTANELNGRVVANVASGNVIGGIPVVHVITIANAPSGDTDVVLTHKTRVIDVSVVLTATGDAGNTYTVANGGSAITNAITPGATDTTLARAAQLNDANWDIAAAGTLRVTHVRNAGSSAAIVFVTGLRIA